MCKNNRAQTAFTLVELLVAMAITILIVAFLGRVLISTTTVWQLSGERIDTFRDARSALQLMTNDLTRANVNGDGGMLTLANVPGGADYATEAYAVFPTKNNGKSDLCATGYYLDWDNGSKTFSLRRFFKNSDSTTPSLAKSSVDFATLYDRTQGTTPETIASYVWALEIRPGIGANKVAPSTSSTSWQWLEVRFKAMSVNAGRKIGVISSIGKTTWGDPSLADYRRFILPNEQQFVTRIQILQKQ